jgi:hypothetical protein
MLEEVEVEVEASFRLSGVCCRKKGNRVMIDSQNKFVERTNL